MFTHDRGSQVFSQPPPEAVTWFTLLLVFVVLTLVFPFASPSSTIAEEASPDRSTVEACPGDPSDPLTFFTEKEITAWKQYQHQKMWTHLIGLGSILAFYLVLIITGLNRALKGIAERSSAWCYQNPSLIRAGRRWPFLA